LKLKGRLTTEKICCGKNDTWIKYIAQQ